MNEDKNSNTDDPAEYLFKQTEFHDCHMTVGDPSTSDVERIGVVKTHLMAHSRVFRKMLMSSDLADPSGSNTHIKDVRPEIFKLMLKHMYGGKLQELQTINKDMILELALCADKYNIPRLVQKTCKRMIPKNAAEIFVPLHFVVYVPNPVLVPHVTKFVQEETGKIIQHKEFLSLDENCMEFITKQDKLAINEEDLWSAVIKWGKYKTQHSNATFLEIINKPLANMRFAAFSIDQVIKEIVLRKILSPAEAMQLIAPIINNFKVHECPTIKKKRGIAYNYSSMECDIDGFSFQHKGSWTPFEFYGCEYEAKHQTDVCCDESTLSVKNCTQRPIVIESLEFKSNCIKHNMPLSYDYQCSVTIVKHVDGYSKGVFIAKSNGNIVREESVVIPMKSWTERYCILEPDVYYKVLLKFSHVHPVYNIVNKRTGQIQESGYGRSDSDIYVDLIGKNFHILKVNYIVLRT